MGSHQNELGDLPGNLHERAEERTRVDMAGRSECKDTVHPAQSRFEGIGCLQVQSDELNARVRTPLSRLSGRRTDFHPPVDEALHNMLTHRARRTNNKRLHVHKPAREPPFEP